MAAKRDESVRGERGGQPGTSGQRRAVVPEDVAGADRREGRPISDSVPAGSILDRLGYVPVEPAGSRRAPALGRGRSVSEEAGFLADDAAPDTWSSALSASLPAEGLPAEGEDPTTPPPQTLRDHLAQSGGFYSRVVPSVESVSIPRPPRVPDLDPADTTDAPPPGSDTPPMGRRIPSARVPRPEAVLIPPLLRRQAEDWQKTGSLTLPNTVSSRHARALQRALLLAMLQSTEFALLPEGIAQRAAWMFREGWGEGKKARDADDLCFVLGLSAGPSARHAVIAAATVHIPAESMLPPSSARWSSRPPPRPDR